MVLMRLGMPRHVGIVAGQNYELVSILFIIY